VFVSSSSSKPPTESQPEQHNKVTGKKPVDNAGKALFVKINMDGVPIRRKVDLIALKYYSPKSESGAFSCPSHSINNTWKVASVEPS